MKKMIVVILLVFISSMFHGCIEWKYENDSDKGIIEQISECTEKDGEYEE